MTDVQALVGWRSGKVMQLECRLAAPGSHAAVDETAGRIGRMQLSPEVRPPQPLFCASAGIALQACS